MARHNDFGANGEQIARRYLEESGYEILDQNWTFGKAEIDLIAYKDSTIVFAEVKTRRNNTFAEPEDFVSDEKQRLLAFAADEYIHLMDHQHEVRFDIITVLIDRCNEPEIRHIEDAFWP
ncbi:YraN family protein [Daejeonella sp. H1SJ63]|jgi:putative endonuclease|uniref:YraN family protein n=1 Tax=Daejeonella sp. H1SJ63 TaxID=3034145 RepID=UPI0023ECA58B|nr:YraN family protein [Daejeonella sp. H1SJ63]